MRHGRIGAAARPSPEMAQPDTAEPLVTRNALPQLGRDFLCAWLGIEMARALNALAALRSDVFLGSSHPNPVVWHAGRSLKTKHEEQKM